MLVIELDNALGSARGDVDDGFALAVLLGSAGGSRERVVVSTYGNTSEAESDRNNRALTALAGVRVRHLRGCAAAGARVAEAVDFLCDAGAGARVLALGPLTTLAATLVRKPDLALAEVVVVGGDRSSRGRWPPWWPHEFNFTHDRSAAQVVFGVRAPLTLVPIDVGRRFLLPRAWIAELPGVVGAHLRTHAERRLRRNRRLLWLDALRGYDVLAAATVFAPAMLQVVPTRAALHARGFVRFGCGRDVSVVAGVDASALRAAFVAALPRGGKRDLD